MTVPLNPVKAGIAIGTLAGLWHAAWCALVASGQAAAFLAFILDLHFLQVSLTVLPFSLAKASLLLALSLIVGFAAGAILALAWNGLNRTPQTIADRLRTRAF